MPTTTKRAYKYRFYPTPDQESLLRQTFGCVRVVYNKALEERAAAWRNGGRHLGFAESSRNMTTLKRTPEYAWLNEVSSVALQQSLRHLESAFRNFWSGRCGHPRFKSKKGRQSATFSSHAFRWTGTTLTLAKMPTPLDIRWSRPLPPGVVPSSVTVSLDAAGRWHISILVEETLAALPMSNNFVGVDLGLVDFAVLSTGEKVANPRFLRRDRARIANAQRKLAKKEKGSKNRNKSRIKLARMHARAADRRRDFLHKLSTRLIRENQAVAVEDLRIVRTSTRGDMRARGLNRSIGDTGWSQFRSMLEYKAHWYGRDLIVVDRWFPSSQLCSMCGEIGGKKPLRVRSWTCTCGAQHDRDINAAKNILAAGLAVSVCGDGRSLDRTPVR